jgi:hypothetical protein
MVRAEVGTDRAMGASERSPAPPVSCCGFPRGVRETSQSTGIRQRGWDGLSTTFRPLAKFAVWGSIERNLNGRCTARAGR